MEYHELRPPFLVSLMFCLDWTDEVCTNKYNPLLIIRKKWLTFFDLNVKFFVRGSISEYSLAYVLLRPRRLSAQPGRPHLQPIKRCVRITDVCGQTDRSRISIPITEGFNGFGYFLHTACTTVIMNT
ncbi:hypothetical protein DERP_004466 [Dermatophagoides pteronyssinus]|uniref:Secreted protein n=1 Tax=Dermatophagoides pteronyssinus TaxID=6956 RepID=A0ABQ8JNU9_DERPT|nr:hypothetical protein DERP_004466 [Dermatophagoides pteronyssinus]